MDRPLNKPNPKVKKVVVIFGLLFAVTGLLTFMHALGIFFAAQDSAGWMQTKGTIISSKVKERYIAGQGTRHGHNHNTLYVPEINYTYQVNNTEYVGNKIKFSATGDSSGKEARAYTAKYKPGDTVSVYYSPDDHAQSVLIPGTDRKTNASVFGGIVFIVFGVIVILARNLYATPADSAGSLGHNNAESPAAESKPTEAAPLTLLITSWMSNLAGHTIWLFPLVILILYVLFKWAG